MFELVYRTGSSLAVIPAFADGFAWLQKKMGYSYLTPDNAMKFIAHPLTLLLLVACVWILLCLTLVEISALLVSYRYSESGRRISTTEMFVLGTHKAFMLIKAHPVLSFIWTAFFFPVVNVHIIIRLCLDIPFFSYLIAFSYRHITNLRLIEIIFGTVLICGGISIFLVPRFLLKKTRRLAKSVMGPSIFMLIIGNILIVMLLQLLCYGIAFLLAAALYYFVGPDTAWVRAVLYESKASYVTAMLSGMIGMMFNAAIIFAVYQRCREKDRDVLMEGIGRLQDLVTWKLRQAGNFFLALLLSLEGIALIMYVKNDSLWVDDLTNPVAITAHRGSADNAPENTIAALKAAIEQMADYAEIDVQESADGVVFLLHDTNLKRTTGWNRPGYQVSFQQINKLDAGSYFSEQFADVHIPSLEQVLQYCKGKIKLNIELKANSRFQDMPEKVVDLIEKYEFEDQCVITSANLDYLRQVKEKNPHLKTGYIMQIVMGESQGNEYDFFSIQYRNATRAFVESAHSAGKEVHVWTVNDNRDIEQMKALKVDNIITNNPVRVWKVLQKKEGDNDFSDWLSALFVYGDASEARR